MASRFVGEDLFRCIHLPIRFHELAAAGGRFHLKPLPPLLSGDGSFYLVAIGENHVRVFQGTHHTVTELHEKSLPASLHEALSAEPSNATATSQPESGLPSTMGTLQRSRTGNTRLRYFRQSDASLRSLLNQRQAPLVLAGFEDLLSGLSDANTYPVLLPSGVPDNPDRVSAEDQLREILSAIYEGSVGRLFIKTDVELWGAYDAARAK